MSKVSKTSAVFFIGQRSFRSRRTIRTVLIRFAMSAAAFLVAGGLAQPFLISGYVRAIVLIAGIIALAFGTSLLCAFAIARVDRLTITDRGVKYGGRFWKWARLGAFRARRNRPSGAIRLLIWDGQDRGTGFFLAIDEPVSPESAVHLINRIRQCCSANQLDVTCEALC